MAGSPHSSREAKRAEMFEFLFDALPLCCKPK